jgi:lipooligosaccharide transport system ATP-binding protein
MPGSDPTPAVGPTLRAGEPMVTARGLTKRFDSFLAVDGIDFDIGQGESYGLLGPNGAGKTSTMRMIACMSPVSGGTLRVLGLDPATDGARIRGRIGLVPQEDTLDLELTVLDNLMIYGRYFDLPKKVIRQRAEGLLEFSQLADRAHDKVEPLSGGMKRRLTIARALVSEPELLILDEPTTGLDPQARHLLWDRLYRLKLQGVTLVVTTHYMDEAEQLCDRLAVMDRGRFAAEDTPAALIGRYSTREVVELRFGPGEHDDVAAKLDGLVERFEVLPDRLLLHTDDGDSVLDQVHHRGLRPDASLVRRSTLEDVFLRLTGRSLVE